MKFAVEQEAFQGPLGLLLELIEKEELDITKVSLASVADGYLKFLDEHEVPATELADFLLVASRLIYLKSRSIMPAIADDEEEASAKRLEDQLRLYKEYAGAAEKLAGRFMTSPMYARKAAKLVITGEPTFIPAKNVVAITLREVFGGILKRLQPFLALQEASMARAISVEERLAELTDAIRTRAQMSFRDVVRGAGSKMDVVVSFLALLELLRRKVIHAKQLKPFEDIELRRATTI